MTPYQPFLIAPFGTGLDTDVSPWLLPQDAFSSMEDAHIRHNVIEKRQGFTKLGDFVHGDLVNWAITTVSAASPSVVTVTSTAGLSEGDQVELRDVSTMTEVNGQRYKVANLGGATFELTDSDGNAVDGTLFTGAGTGGLVVLVPGNRIMGLWQYTESSSVSSFPSKTVVAFDTERACQFNTTTNRFDPIDDADIMASSSTQYVWGSNWSSASAATTLPLVRLYFSNDEAYDGTTGGIRHWSGGATSTLFSPRLTATAVSPAIHILGCRLLFVLKQRLLCLNTVEGLVSGGSPVRYPQRVRWCQIQNPDNADAWVDTIQGRGGFVDCPTGDHIISAQLLEDGLVVFFNNSVWTLRPTPDPALPFRWDQVNSFRACDAKMGSAPFDRYVVGSGLRGITATDGIETQRIDERIEDFVRSDINDSEWEKVFMKRSFGDRRMWMLYPEGTDEENTGSLIYDDESSAYSQYNISMNVLGQGGAAIDSGLQDFGSKDLSGFVKDETLLSFFYDDGAETFIGGDRSGIIHTMESGGSDNEVIISLSIINITQVNPGVVTVGSTYTIADGDTVYIDDVVGMTEVNGLNFIVANKTGNTFELTNLSGTNVDTSAYTAYGSGGIVAKTTQNDIGFELFSAAWNPWMSEGKQSQMGYLDIYCDTDRFTELNFEFYRNNDTTAYSTKKIDLLPSNMREVGGVSFITKSIPAVVTCGSHGLSDGKEIYIYKVTGMLDVNGGPYTVTVIDDDCFSIGIDSSNFLPYSNGGVVTGLEFRREKSWKRVYAGGTGYQHRIKIRSSGSNRPVYIHGLMPWFRPRSRRPI